MSLSRVVAFTATLIIFSISLNLLSRQYIDSGLVKLPRADLPVLRDGFMAKTRVSPQVVPVSKSRCLLYGSGWYLVVGKQAAQFKILAWMGRRKIDESEIPSDFNCNPGYFSQSTVQPSGLRKAAFPSERFRFRSALTSNGEVSPRHYMVEQIGDSCKAHSDTLRLNFRRDQRIVTAFGPGQRSFDLPWYMDSRPEIEDFWCREAMGRIDGQVFETLLNELIDGQL